MKKILILLSIINLVLSSCVQPAYEQEINVTLDVSKVSDVKTVGVRGEGSPLSWNKDLPLNPIVKDSLYGITLKVKTGYKFGEFKFTINDKFELEDKDNRRIYFDESKITNYKAVFDKAN